MNHAWSFDVSKTIHPEKANAKGYFFNESRVKPALLQLFNLCIWSQNYRMYISGVDLTLAKKFIQENCQSECCIVPEKLRNNCLQQTKYQWDTFKFLKPKGPMAW